MALASPAPLEGQSLNEFVQPIIAAITGLPGNLVRPAFQAEPPTVADGGVAWAAFRYTSRASDTFPQITHDGINEQDQLHRHEEVSVLVSFYDLGTGGKADYYAALLRDGLAIPQNLQKFQLNGMGFISCENMVAVPVLLKQRWMYRVDLPFSFRREIIRYYASQNITKAQGSVTTDTNFKTSL